MAEGREASQAAHGEGPADDLCGAVLCGGASARMGTDKARAVLGGRPLIELALDCLDAVCGEVLLATGAEERYPELGRRAVLDDRERFGGGGAALGLEAALAAAGAEWLCVLACDMPRVRPEHLRALAGRARAEDLDACLMRTQAGLEPTLAVYHRRCLAPLRRALERGDRRLVAFHSGEIEEPGGRRRPVRIGTLDEASVGGSPATNLNTPDELAHERARWEAADGRQGACA